MIDLLREKPGAEDKDVIGSAICAKAQELQVRISLNQAGVNAVSA